MAVLGDLGNFIDSISTDVTSVYRSVTQPGTSVTPGTAIPGRPGYVYGPGGSVQAINPATGGLLPAVNSGVVGQQSGTVLLIVGVIALFVAFVLSARH